MGKAFSKEYLDSLIGKKQGFITILSHFKKGKNNYNYFLCKCDCGKIAEIQANHFLNHKQQTCGRHHKKYENSQIGNHIYNTWNKMIARCYNPNNKKFESYGKRGIKVCDEWKNNYDNFYNWAITNGYKPNLWIERIDNNGNYSPNNCKWATRKEQMRNTRRNHFITYNGETHCIAEWAEILNLPYSTLNSRIYKNMDIHKAFTTPYKKR